MTIKKLKNRWLEEDFDKALEVLETLKVGRGIFQLDYPKTQEGKIDLRGFEIKKILAKIKGKFIADVEGIYPKKLIFEQVDFSYGDFSTVKFKKCKFEDSTFYNSRFLECTFWGCQLKNLQVSKSSFAYSSFDTNGIIWKEKINNLENCNINHTSFHKTSFLHQGMLNIDFSDCKFGESNIYDTRIKNTRFSGEIRNLKFEGKRGKTQTDNCDLSNAKLIGIKFFKHSFNGIKFPEGDTYHFFTNKTSELDQVHPLQNETEQSLVHLWKAYKSKTGFVDINWLKESEIEQGKHLIRRLKNL